MLIPLRTTRIPFLSIIVLSLLLACKTTKSSGKPGTGKNSTAPAIASCQQVIRYYFEKFRDVQNARDIAVTAIITIDPLAKNINTSAQIVENGEKGEFDMTIEHFDCTLNADLTIGEALYTGHIRQQDGSSTKAYLKLEAKDGSLVMSNGDPAKASEVLMYVSKWEIVKPQP
jgi:major membrane immunogen (membrane-anchored lipoprotein)